MADARIEIGDATIEVLASRAEQLATLLALDDWRGGKALSDRIGRHIADGEEGEPFLHLDEHEQRELLDVVQQLLEASDAPPGDLLELRAALRHPSG